jgi:hypothetical protein
MELNCCFNRVISTSPAISTLHISCFFHNIFCPVFLAFFGKTAERGRPRPQQGTDGDATWMFRWRLDWQRCCARGRARSGLISGWPVGTNAVPKSFCDGRLGQLVFEFLNR